MSLLLLLAQFNQCRCFVIRHKQRKSVLFKECFNGFVLCSTCLVRFVQALARVNMTWLLGSTRKQNQQLCHHMYALLSLQTTYLLFLSCFFVDLLITLGHTNPQILDIQYAITFIFHCQIFLCTAIEFLPSVCLILLS